MANLPDCKIVVSMFLLQSRYYIQFRTYTIEKVINALHPPNYWLNSTIILPPAMGK